MARLICLALVCLLVAGCGLFDIEGDDRIKYEVTGTASSVSIIIHNAGGNIEELSEVSVPWSSQEFKPKYREETDGRFYHAYISAKNNGDSGSVTVTIYNKGEVRETATSKGAYVTATASSRVRSI